MKTLKNISKLYDEEYDLRSQELFDKNFYELEIGEKEILCEYMNDLRNPEWLPVIINNHITNYMISNTGILKNIRTNHIVNVNISYKGYSGVQLYLGKENGKDKHLNTFIHRLVAIAFIPNPENKPQVNHINGKKYINLVGNLEWVTQTENINHAINTGLMMKPGKGIDGRNCSHTKVDVHKVCKMLEKGIPINIIANKLNVTRAFIIGIKYNGNWSDIRSKYKIPDSNTYGNRTDQQKLLMRKLVEKGNRNRRKILETVGLPYTKTNISYVKYLIRIENDKIVKGSTTIKHLSDGGNASEPVLVTPQVNGGQ